MLLLGPSRCSDNAGSAMVARHQARLGLCCSLSLGWVRDDHDDWNMHAGWCQEGLSMGQVIRLTC